MYIYKIYHMYASSFAIRSPSVSFSETWSILSKIFLQKFFLSSQKIMLARKNSWHKMKSSKWLTSLGAHLFSFGAKGKVRSRSTVTPLIRSVLLNLLPKVVPIDVDSVDAFSDQLCHIEPAGLVCHIAASRYSCKPNFQLSLHFMRYSCKPNFQLSLHFMNSEGSDQPAARLTRSCTADQSSSGCLVV